MPRLPGIRAVVEIDGEQVRRAGDLGPALRYMW
jgi:hypothetical protein